MSEKRDYFYNSTLDFFLEIFRMFWLKQIIYFSSSNLIARLYALDEANNATSYCRKSLQKKCDISWGKQKNIGVNLGVIFS